MRYDKMRCIISEILFLFFFFWNLVLLNIKRIYYGILMKILIKYSIIRSICKVKLFFDEVENHEYLVRL